MASINGIKYDKIFVDEDGTTTRYLLGGKEVFVIGLDFGTEVPPVEEAPAVAETQPAPVVKSKSQAKRIKAQTAK